MISLSQILDKAQVARLSLGLDDIVQLLSLEGASEIEALFHAAYRVKERYIGRNVSIRGLIESGNVCAKDCLYCGIRKSNTNVTRYSMTADEIVALSRRAKEFGYASIVIQSGEIESEVHTAMIEEVLERVRPLNLGITLSLGEQSAETYRRWREAGASRYLLRIETSNKELYSTLHPADHSWERRKECLSSLAECGYQLGTGVMIGLPGQTMVDLARDIMFFGEVDADMIGMGPFIPHHDTPFKNASSEGNFLLGLKMIAATRLYLHDVNIAAATALQALDPKGREKGILAGANVIMPNMTEVKYRDAYALYDGKPCTGENAAECRACLDRRIEAIGEKILYGKTGDSPHYFAKSR